MAIGGTPVGNMIIKVDLDAVGVEKSMTGLQRQLKSSNKAMGAQLSAFDRSEKSADKYSTVIKGLSDRHKIQAAMVDEAKNKYDDMTSTYGENSVKAQAAAQDLNTQIARYQETGRELDTLTAEFEEFQRVQDIQSKGWYKVADGMDNWGGKLKTAGTNMSDVGSKMTRGITFPAVGATAAVGGIVAAFGWKRLTGLDTAQAQLKGLGYSTKDVGRISEDVTKAIDGGMTTMAEGTAVAAGAMAAGVKEGKELRRYIKLVGDAAIGANRPVDEMAQTFNRVEGSGKLMTQELNSIEMSMPGFSKAMSKHLGVSSEKLREMVTDGKVSSKDFKDVMEDFAGGMAEEYSKTWDGMVANTKAYVGIIGESFLQGVFEDSKKSLADFIEVLKSPEIQQRAAEMGEVARESFGKMKDSIVGVVEWYQNLDDGQKTMIKRLGLVAVAGGPVLQGVGKLTTGIGALVQITGSLAKAIGLSKGAGALGAMSGLSKTGVAGLAIAGVGALGYATYKYIEKAKESKEVNLDVAESLTDQAVELEKNADTFDKLSDKAKISNEQLAELNDLNIRISESSNPGEIKELQEQYDALAKKSGLSKDELKNLFKANENIIEQAPDVEKSVSDQGNAFADNTEKVREYIDAMLEASRQELEAAREDQLKRQNELTDDLIKKERQLEDMQEALVYSDELRTKSKEELLDLDAELTEQMNEAKQGSEEWLALDEKRTALNKAMNGNAEEYYFQLAETIKEKRKSVDLTKEEIAELEAETQALADIYLQQVGITEQGEKGLATLDKSIAKSDEELEQLDNKLEKNGKLTQEEQDRYDVLVESNGKQRDTRDLIFEELGLYKDINSLAEHKLDNLDSEGQKKIKSLAKTSEIKVEEGNIVKQIEKKNKKLLEERESLVKNLEKQGETKEEIDKQTSSIDKKIGRNDENIKRILQELGIWDDVKDSISTGSSKIDDKNKKTDEGTNKTKKQGDQLDKNNRKVDAGKRKAEGWTSELGKDVSKDVKARLNPTVANINRALSAPISKRVNVSQNVVKSFGGSTRSVRAYAKGTPSSGHPGGPAVVGEEGQELISTPGGASFLSPGVDTLLDLPRGSHVMPHQETERILKNTPHYADGIGNFNFGNLRNSEFMKLLALDGKRQKNKKTNNSANNDMKDLKDTVMKLSQLVTDLVKNNKQEIEQNITINSPEPTSPSDNARELRRANRLLGTKM